MAAVETVVYVAQRHRRHCTVTLAPIPWSDFGLIIASSACRHVAVWSLLRTLSSKNSFDDLIANVSLSPLMYLYIKLLNAKIVGFNRVFGDFGLRDTFQERIARKQIEIDMEKLHTKFSSPDFLGSRKPAHEGIKVLP